MKRFALWVFLASAIPGLRAQTPDAEFLQIYTLLQEGESMERSGQIGPAMERFQQARRDLEQFSKANPSWNRKIVNFRLGYLGEKVGSLKERLPQPGTTETRPGPASTEKPATSSPTVTPAGFISSELTTARSRAQEAEARASAAEARIDLALHKADEATARANEIEERSARIALDLRQAIDRVEVLEATERNLERSRSGLERERATLQAKLSEALSPKPAALDPAELRRSQERNRLLTMENEILKASLEHQMAQNQKMAAAAAKSAEFEEKWRAARADLDVAHREANDLRQERQKLQVRLDTVTRKKEEQSADFQAQIDNLHKDVAVARSKGGADSTKEWVALRQELTDQRTASDGLRRENASLRHELERYTAIQVTPSSLKIPEVPIDELPAAEAARAERAERERDDLHRQLEVTRAELNRRDPAPMEARNKDLTEKVSRLEGRLRILEGQKVPCTPEELALFEKPASVAPVRPLQLAQANSTTPATPEKSPPPAARSTQAPNSPAPASKPVPTNAPPSIVPMTNAPAAGASSSPTNQLAKPAISARRRTTKDLPAGAGSLARQAETAFSLHHLDEAEQAYREILKLDEDNVYTLGNLAAILVQQGKTPEAETMVNRALTLDAEDPFSLSLQGLIRFKQQRYDDAFNALSRSAQLDPENAETYNYLGITLSERGDRKGAEAALRKAVKLNPNSAMAHYNLAVVYATQKPPFMELARYHYQKARRAGQPANPSFEGVLKGDGTPSAPK